MRLLYLVLTLLGGLLAGTARAQDSTAVARPAAAVALATAPVAPPDTAAAIHRLFVAKRGLRAAVVVGTSLAYVLAVVAGPDKYGSYDGQALRIVGYTPFLLGALIGEFAYFGRYGYRHERRALADWQRHRLAPELRCRLTPTYFEPDRPRHP